MYLESKKAVYLTLEASLIFWKKIFDRLEKWSTKEMNIIGM